MTNRDKSPVLIASDHAGYELKEKLKKALPEVNWSDLGPADDGRVDYPDFAEKLARDVSKNGGRGILICGSGIGMSIAANRIAGVRAALVNEPVSARLSREHNDANVLCLAGRFLAPEYAAEIAKVWLETPFSDGERHKNRIKKMDQIK